MHGNNSVRSSHNIPVSVISAQISGLQRNTLLPLLLDQDVSTSSTSSGLSSEAWDQPSSAVILCSKHKGGLYVSIYKYFGTIRRQSMQCAPLLFCETSDLSNTVCVVPEFNVSTSHKTKLRCVPALLQSVLSPVYCTVLFHQPITSSLSPMPPVMNVMNMKTSGSQVVQCPCLDFPFYPGRISNVRLDECKGG